MVWDWIVTVGRGACGHTWVLSCIARVFKHSQAQRLHVPLSGIFYTSTQLDACMRSPSLQYNVSVHR